jgi:hypothetical protein
MEKSTKKTTQKKVEPQDIDKLKASTELFFNTLGEVANKKNFATIGMKLVKTIDFTYRNRKEIKNEINDLDNSEIVEYLVFLGRIVPPVFGFKISEVKLKSIETLLNIENGTDSKTKTLEKETVK